MYFRIAIKSIISRRKQYNSLFFVCIAGFCISLLCLSLMNGMLTSLYKKAKVYYGGDLQFLGGTNKLGNYDSQEILSKINAVFSEEDVIICPRYEAYSTGITFFFEGVEVSQRILKGVNFDIEKEIFTNLTFVDGGINNIKGTNGILISKPIAQKLQVKVGDRITIMKPTNAGFKNTTEFLVSGIFKDSSLFGMYTAYVDIQQLLTLLDEAPTETNRIGIYFKDNSKLTTKRLKEYQAKLESEFNTMYPLTNDKEKFYDYLRSSTTLTPTFALITLDANLKDLNLLIGAMRFILYSIIVTLALIIAIGIGNSYKVIVMKRIREIGMYRSLGMSIPSINLIFLSETLIVISSGFIIGLLLQYGGTSIISLINFSFIPAFDIFLQSGTLQPKLKIVQIIILFISVTVTTLVSVLFTIREGVAVNPVDALSTTE